MAATNSDVSHAKRRELVWKARPQCKSSLNTINRCHWLFLMILFSFRFQCFFNFFNFLCNVLQIPSMLFFFISPIYYFSISKTNNIVAKKRRGLCRNRAAAAPSKIRCATTGWACAHVTSPATLFALATSMPAPHFVAVTFCCCCCFKFGLCVCAEFVQIFVSLVARTMLCSCRANCAIKHSGIVYI
jgi:hypothetical protein